MVCIIFDLDGTLVDSEPACNKAFLDLLPDLSDTVDELVNRHRGKKLAEILIDLQARLSRPLPPDFEHHYRARVAALFDTELQPMEGVEKMLGAIGLPVCVASSGPAHKIYHALEVTGLSRFFDGRVFSSYDVVVEDSSIGIEAAVSAGMRPIQYLPNRAECVAPGATPLRNFRQLHQLLRASP